MAVTINQSQIVKRPLPPAVRSWRQSGKTLESLRHLRNDAMEGQFSWLVQNRQIPRRLHSVQSFDGMRRGVC